MFKGNEIKHYLKKIYKLTVGSKSDVIVFLFSAALGLYSLLLSLYYSIFGDKYFNTDIARHFLLVEDAVNKSYLPLIGARSGGIPGTFFGPLWIYLNIPVFQFFNGNPAAIMSFWYILVLLTVILTALLAYKVFGWQSALVSGAIFLYYGVNFSMGFTSSFLSVILSPVIFYLIYRFWQDKRLSQLLLLIFFNGLMLQFQPAFGIILLAMNTVCIIYLLFKFKKLHYLLSYLVLVIPLATYIVFELRHNFLEISSLLKFLFQNQPHASSINFVSLVLNRFGGFMGRLNLLENPSVWIGWAFIVLNIYIFIKAYLMPKNDKKRLFLLIFYCFYFAFWIITLFFRGWVWDPYSLGFLPIAVVAFSTLYHFNRKVFLVVFALMFLYFMNSNLKYPSSEQNFSRYDSSSWKRNEKVAESIFTNAGNNFGYFVFSPDEFGYTGKYAMDFVQRQFPEKKAVLCQKEKETYIIYFPSLGANDWLYWKNNKVHINVSPVETMGLGPIKVEKYLLSQAQTKIAVDPNLICNLQFR